MIRITKPTDVPKILLTKGEDANSKNQKSYNRNPKAYIEGRKKIKIHNTIYGHPTVKKIIKEAQNNKCCFCEKDQVDENGAVEHFRPKEGYKIAKGDQLSKPGYYWLGYNWDNLFFVCNTCNSAGNKGNLFPLANEAERAKSHKDDVDKETPLLLDPGGQKNPRKHIFFENEFVRSKTKFGKKTIEICGLDRDALNNMRKDVINKIQLSLAILGTQAVQTSENIEKAKEVIRNSVKPTCPFSAVANDFLKQFPSVSITSL